MVFRIRHPEVSCDEEVCRRTPHARLRLPQHQVGGRVVDILEGKETQRSCRPVIERKIRVADAAEVSGDDAGGMRRKTVADSRPGQNDARARGLRVEPDRYISPCPLVLS